MDDEERRHARDRREILSAYVLAVDRPTEVLRVAASMAPDADDDALIAAIATAFDVSDVAAHAIVDLQVRRFTPRRIAQLREELGDLDRRLAQS